MTEVFSQQQSVTVMLSTYNRAQCLFETLEAFCSLDIKNIDVEFVVIDNNSSDNTSEVIESFKGKLPLVHLFESRPGKNCALNHALKTVKLKYITVFTDDDVTPEQDWLKRIVSAVNDYPNYSVFGGAIKILWPTSQGAPSWCQTKWIQALCFVSNEELGGIERQYPEGSYPIGPNLWIRSKILDGGYKYNENIGPRPNNRLMGSETSFLIGLKKLGYEFYFVPSALVMHRPQPNEMTIQAVERRGYRYGRSQPHLDRLRFSVWKPSLVYQLIQLLHGLLSLLYSKLPGDPSTRFASRFGGLVRIGNALETLSLMWQDVREK